jgi:anti-anti-sigma factor
VGQVAEFRLHAASDGVFYLAGELDLLSAERLEAEVSEAGRTAPSGEADLVFDLSDLTFVDSTGIRAFLRLARAITPRCLVLRAPTAHVAHVLEIVGIQSFGIRLEQHPPAPDGPRPP